MLALPSPPSELQTPVTAICAPGSVDQAAHVPWADDFRPALSVSVLSKVEVPPNTGPEGPIAETL